MAEMLRSSSAGLIIRQKEPTNLETPLDQVDSYLTPTELFYIRSHFPAPRLDPTSYQLRIDGAVRNPLSLSYQQLRDMPSETRVATLECAGNCRVFLIPQVAGAQWELGAVGNAEWTGVPLEALLERAGLEEDACEIVLEGADRGMPAEQPIPSGPISYARSLPRDKAMKREVLIGFDLLLAVVVGLVLYAASARDPQAPPDFFDGLQLLLVVSALVVDGVALAAIAARLSEFGFTPNRVAALGENLILLVNLAWSAWLYACFLRHRGSFADLERWQIAYLPVYSVWAALVVVMFPPVFGYR